MCGAGRYCSVDQTLTDTPDETPQIDPDVEFLQGLSTQDPQVRKRIFTVLLRAVVTNKGPGR